MQGRDWVLWELFPGIPLAFRLDGLGMLFLLVAAVLWPLTTAYSIGYMRKLKEHDQSRFFAFFAIAIFATVGVALAANLVTLYLFYELLSLSTYPLVTHHQDDEARSAGRRYLAFILGGSIGLVLPAMALIGSYGNPLDFTGQGLQASNSIKGAVVLAFLFGFSKAGVMPMHPWLPGAMVAPTPVSSLLHAVAVVKVGVFSIIRALTGVLGPNFLVEVKADMLVVALTATTVLVSALIMLSQDNLKRCLAFSTIGQLSYILLGVFTLSPSGTLGGVLHISMHAVGKITLFFCAGAIYVAHKKKYISQLDGIGHKMPFTMTAFTIGTMAIVGLPLTGGFISKWLILTGCFERGFLLVALVVVASSFLKACTLFPIVFRAFFKKPEEPGFQEAPWWCVVPLCLTATLSVLSFFNPGPMLDLARDFVVSLNL